jgi:serine/threonine protein kinase
MKRGRWDDSDEEEQKVKPKEKPKVKASKKSAVFSEDSKDNQIKSPGIVEAQISRKNSFRLARRVYEPLVRSCRSIDCYEHLNFIDQGTYGLVFRARCLETNEIYALKQVKYGNEVNKIGFPSTALREINILLTLNHPNIIPVREVVVDPLSDKVFMVMEYCENDLKTCMAQHKQSFSIAEVGYFQEYFLLS